MENYKLICKTDLYHAAQSSDFDRDGIKDIDSELTREQALKALDNIARSYAHDDNVYIESEEEARQWLLEIEGDGQGDRESWLKDIIERGEYGLYEIDGDIIYKRGDDSFMYDIYYFSIE